MCSSQPIAASRGAKALFRKSSQIPPHEQGPTTSRWTVTGLRGTGPRPFAADPWRRVLTFPPDNVLAAVVGQYVLRGRAENDGRRLAWTMCRLTSPMKWTY